MERDMVTRPDAAIENLTNYQGQADMHGETVIVSRQALDEALAYIKAVEAARHRTQAQAELLDALENLRSACIDHHVDTREAEAAIAKAIKGEQP